MRYVNYYLSIILILLFTQANSQGFELHGTLVGFEDNTKIIINPYLDNMDIDMENETILLLKDGKFKFKRQLEKPTKYSLRVPPIEQDNIVEFEYLNFWAENKSMTLTGTKGQIFQSKISGSQIQDQYYDLILSIAQLTNERKHIADSVKIIPDLSKEKISEMRVRYRKNQKIIDTRNEQFIYSNPNYYCSAPQLVFKITFLPSKQIDRNKFYEFYNNMDAELQSNVYGKQIMTFLKSGKEEVNSDVLKVGDIPYDFTLNDTSNIRVKFSSIKNKIILLDFWSSGCGPCRHEHKNYVKLYDDFKDKKLEIVSVSQDRFKKRLTDAIKKDKMSWICLWDESKKVSRDLYNVYSLPTNYLIFDGKIVAKTLRGEELRIEIEKYLKQAEN